MLEEANLLKVDNGATIVDLEKYDLPPALIKKSDGATLYMTRDLAAANYRKNTYDFANVLRGRDGTIKPLQTIKSSVKGIKLTLV